MNEAIDDDWENYEIQPLEFYSSVQSKLEQLKILEERRLIEEADNELTDELFASEDKLQKKLTINLTKSFIQKEKQKNNEKINRMSEEINKKIGHKINKQKLNEEKQKEYSNSLKKQKEDKKRLADIYGEAQEKNDKYSYYEDQFYE
jgi:hypothetical protein